MKQFIVLILNTVGIFILNFELLAQPSITWQKTYNGPYNHYEGGWDVCSATDGNFIVAGLTYVGGSNQRALVLKINPYGDTLWFRVIENKLVNGAYCCVATNDGGCVITGVGLTNFAVRLNGDGSIRWTKFYGTSSIINNDIKKVIGGGFIFCGRNIDRIGFVTKIDTAGNLIWEKPFPSGFSRNFRSILNCIDSGFIISGTVRDNNLDTGKALIMKISNDGVISWEKRYTIQNQGASIIESDVLDNGYLFGGTVTDTVQFSQGSSFIVKTDINGNIVFSKIFYTSKQEYFYDVKKINENRYLMAVTREDSNTNAKLYLTDSLGKIFYQKVFPNNFFNAFRAVLPLSNGDIIMAGINESGFLPSQTDIYIVRTDSILNSPPLSFNTNSTFISTDFKLFQNYPNPFNPNTTIKYSISKSSFVVIKIYNAYGKEIRTLVDKFLQPNSYKVNFSSIDYSTGVYFYQLILNGNLTETKKMILLK